MDRLRRLAPILYLAILPVLPLWRAVFLGEAIGPFDQIRHMAPWAAPAPDQPWDVLQADGALQFYGWRSMVLESWGKGQIPAWNPYELAGTPLLANSQSGGFYPPIVILGVLHVPATLAITMLAWFHLFWAGLGVLFLARALGSKPIPAAMAGGFFSCSTFMLGWTGLSSVIYTCSWLPWTLAFLLVMFRATPTVRSRWAPALLGVSVGMMFLAGHLQFAAFGSMSLALVWVVKLLDKRFSVSLLAAVSILCGAAIAMPQVLPSLNYSQFSHRRNDPTDKGYDDYVRLAIKPFELGNLSSPTVLGNPRKWSSLEKPHVSSYWPALVKPGANLAESAITVGPLLLLILFLVPWLRKQYWPMGKVGALGLFIALGTPFDRLLYFFVPGWSATGSPGRAGVLFVLAACVLGAQVLSEEELPNWTQDRTKLGLAILATILPLAFSQMGDLPQEAKFLITDAASGGIVDWLLGAFVAGACLFLYQKKQEILFLAPVGAMLSLMFVLIPTGKPLNPVSGPEGNKRIAAINERWDILTNQLALLPPNTASLSHIHELGGYDSLIHVETVDMLKKVVGADPAAAVNGNMMFVKPSASQQELAAAGVTEVWTLKHDPNYPNGRAVLPEVEKTPIAGPGRASTPTRPAEIVEEGYDHLSLKATGPGLLTLRDRNMPGWTAKVDGKSAEIKGTTWREVELGGGEHRIEFKYSPPGMRNGLLLAGVGLIGLLGLGAVRPKVQAAS